MNRKILSTVAFAVLLKNTVYCGLAADVFVDRQPDMFSQRVHMNMPKNQGHCAPLDQNNVVADQETVELQRAILNSLKTYEAKIHAKEASDILQAILNSHQSYVAEKQAREEREFHQAMKDSKKSYARETRRRAQEASDILEAVMNSQQSFVAEQQAREEREFRQAMKDSKKSYASETRRRAQEASDILEAVMNSQQSFVSEKQAREERDFRQAMKESKKSYANETRRRAQEESDILEAIRNSHTTYGVESRQEMLEAVAFGLGIKNSRETYAAEEKGRQAENTVLTVEQVQQNIVEGLAQYESKEILGSYTKSYEKDKEIWVETDAGFCYHFDKKTGQLVNIVKIDVQGDPDFTDRIWEVTHRMEPGVSERVWEINHTQEQSQNVYDEAIVRQNILKFMKENQYYFRFQSFSEIGEENGDFTIVDDCGDTYFFNKETGALLGTKAGPILLEVRLKILSNLEHYKSFGDFTIYSSLIADGNEVLVRTDNGFRYHFDKKTGKLLTTEMDSEVFTAHHKIISALEYAKSLGDIHSYSVLPAEGNTIPVMVDGNIRHFDKKSGQLLRIQGMKLEPQELGRGQLQTVRFEVELGPAQLQDLKLESQELGRALFKVQTADVSSALEEVVFDPLADTAAMDAAFANGLLSNDEPAALEEVIFDPLTNTAAMDAAFANGLLRNDEPAALEEVVFDPLADTAAMDAAFANGLFNNNAELSKADKNALPSRSASPSAEDLQNRAKTLKKTGLDLDRPIINLDRKATLLDQIKQSSQENLRKTHVPVRLAAFKTGKVITLDEAANKPDWNNIADAAAKNYNLNKQDLTVSGIQRQKTVLQRLKKVAEAGKHKIDNWAEKFKKRKAERRVAFAEIEKKREKALRAVLEASGHRGK